MSHSKNNAGWEDALRAFRATEMRCNQLILECGSAAGTASSHPSSTTHTHTRREQEQQHHTQEQQLLQDRLQETQEALAQLTERFFELQAHCPSGLPSQNFHMLRRCQDHMNLLHREFRLVTSRLPISLLSGKLLKPDGSAEGPSRPQDRTVGKRGEALLRERGTLGDTSQELYNTLSTAERVRLDLETQGETMTHTTFSLQNFAGRIPGVNHMLEMIRRRKRRDLFILTGLVAVLLLFSYLWLRL